MNAQALKIAAADRATLVKKFPCNVWRMKTRAIRDALAVVGFKITEDRINKALGRFYRNYGGSVNRLTPHKEKMLFCARTIAPFPLNDQYLLNAIGQADTERGAMARIQKLLESH